MDADGIPLYPTKHRQDALFLDQVCGMSPRITLLRIGKCPFGEYQPKDGTLEAGSRNAAFCR